MGRTAATSIVLVLCLATISALEIPLADNRLTPKEVAVVNPNNVVDISGKVKVTHGSTILPNANGDDVYSSIRLSKGGDTLFVSIVSSGHGNNTRMESFVSTPQGAPLPDISLKVVKLGLPSYNVLAVRDLGKGAGPIVEGEESTKTFRFRSAYLATHEDLVYMTISALRPVTSSFSQRVPKIVCMNQTDLAINWEWVDEGVGITTFDTLMSHADIPSMAVTSAGTIFAAVNYVLDAYENRRGTVVRLDSALTPRALPSLTWRYEVLSVGQKPDTAVLGIDLDEPLQEVLVSGASHGDVDRAGPGRDMGQDDAFFFTMTMETKIITRMFQRAVFVAQNWFMQGGRFESKDEDGNYQYWAMGGVKMDLGGGGPPDYYVLYQNIGVIPCVENDGWVCMFGKDMRLIGAHKTPLKTAFCLPGRAAVDSNYVYAGIKLNGYASRRQKRQNIVLDEYEGAVLLMPTLLGQTWVDPQDKGGFALLNPQVGSHIYVHPDTPKLYNDAIFDITCAMDTCYLSGGYGLHGPADSLAAGGMLVEFGKCPNGTVAGIHEGHSPLTCNICPPGTDQPEQNGYYCHKCRPGYFAANQRTPECAPCPVGYYQPQFGQTSCLPCPAGTHANSTGSPYCDACYPGTYSDASATEHCKQCGNGTASHVFNATDISTCVACAAGSYADATGTAICKKCSPGHYQSLTGQTSCDPCPFRYQLPIWGGVSLSQCEICPAGTKAVKAGAGNCEPCPPGSFQNATGTDFCVECPLRYHASKPGTAECAICPAGTFATNPGMKECVACDVGQYQSLTGQLRCAQCDEKTYSDVKGLPVCKKCPENSWSPRGSIHILACKCNKDTYGAPHEGRACKPCPPTGAKCSQGQSWPETEKGKWIDTGNVFNIQSCIPLSSCPGGKPNAPEVDAGDVWVKDNAPENTTTLSVIHSDPLRTMSTTTYQSPCETGYEGTACRLCQKTFFRSKGKCIACPDASSPLWLTYTLMVLGSFLLVACFLIIICAKSCSQQANHTGIEAGDIVDDNGYRAEDRSIPHRTAEMVSKLIKFLQLTVILFNIKTRWPSTVNTVSSAFAITTLDVNDLFSMECAEDAKTVGEMYKDRYFIRVFFPIFFFVSCIFIYLCATVAKVAFSATFYWKGHVKLETKKLETEADRARQNRERMYEIPGTELSHVEVEDATNTWDVIQELVKWMAQFHIRLRNTTVMFSCWLLILLYVVVHATVVELYGCGQTDSEAGVYVLTAEPSIECFTDSTWIALLPINILGIFVLSFGIPVTIVVLVCFNHAKSKFNPQIRDRYGVLWNSYRPQYYFWEVVTMSFKFLVTLGAALAVLAPADQLYFMLFVSVFFLALHLWYKPYRYKFDNLADGILMCCLVVVVICGLIFDSASDDLSTLGSELLTTVTLSTIVITFVGLSYVVIGGLDGLLRIMKAPVSCCISSYYVANELCCNPCRVLAATVRLHTLYRDPKTRPIVNRLLKREMGVDENGFHFFTLVKAIWALVGHPRRRLGLMNHVIDETMVEATRVKEPPKEEPARTVIDIRARAHKLEGMTAFPEYYDDNLMRDIEVPQPEDKMWETSSEEEGDLKNAKAKKTGITFKRKGKGKGLEDDYEEGRPVSTPHFFFALATSDTGMDGPDTSRTSTSGRGTSRK